ncbi:MAG: hypothetical protein ACREE9_02075 [Stellaceae bacterium]
MPQADGEPTDRETTEYVTAVALFLRTKSITRCPTVCAAPTQATVAADDRAAYRHYIAAKEAARLDRARSLRRLASPWPSPPVKADDRA